MCLCRLISWTRLWRLLDLRDGEAYVKSSPESRRWRGVVFFFLLSSAVILIALQLMTQRFAPGAKALDREGLNKSIHRAFLAGIISLPAIVIIPGAMESRFLLPLYAMAFLVLCFDLRGTILRASPIHYKFAAAMTLLCLLVLFFIVTNQTSAYVDAVWLG